MRYVTFISIAALSLGSLLIPTSSAREPASAFDRVDQSAKLERDSNGYRPLRDNESLPLGAYRKRSKRFKVTWNRYMRGRFQRCVHISVRGRMKGNIKKTHSDIIGEKFHWKNVRILHPRLRVSLTRFIGEPGNPCEGRARVRRYKLSQEWKEKSCDVDMSVSAGIPWSVGVSFGCSDSVVAIRERTSHPGKSYAVQANRGDSLKYDPVIMIADPRPFKAAVRFEVRLLKVTRHGSISQAVRGRGSVKLRPKMS